MIEIPYGRQSIFEEDIRAVVEVLRSDWLTQGPVTEQFERAVAEYCGAQYAVAVANGTAALHLAALAADFRPGAEVITSPITFVASANCIVYTGAKPVFADIDPNTYCIDPEQVRSKLSASTRGLIPVHFAGQPCDMGTLHAIAKEKELIIIEDGAHAIGASYAIDEQSYRVGSCSHSNMTIFSFHPVKHITTGEGGIITTNNQELYRKLRVLRTHGITKDPENLLRQEGPWYYEQQMLGYNYRITDFQCALGLSQLKKLDEFIEIRKSIVSTYNDAFSSRKELIIPYKGKETSSAWHLYVLRFNNKLDRLKIFTSLRNKGIGVNVHYIPVNLHPYYVKTYGYRKGDLPRAEAYYNDAITLPLYPGMSRDDIKYVIHSVLEAIDGTEP
jgi:perosamine synthetase